MKYYIVEKTTDNIRGRVNAVDAKGASLYYINKSKTTETEFNKHFKVMSEEEWNNGFKSGLQNRQSHYEWWHDEETYLDIDS